MKKTVIKLVAATLLVGAFAFVPHINKSKVYADGDPGGGRPIEPPDSVIVTE